MTLILAIPAINGVIVASDGQVTYGEVRWAEKKIKELNTNCLWSAAGELAFIQRVEELINKLPNKGESLDILRDSLSDVVKESITILLRKDFRTQFIQPPNPELMLSLHQGDFMFVEFRESTKKILHILSNGTSEWINTPFACGSGAGFAYALLQKYKNLQYDLQKASILAYKILEESIETGSWGLGYPIDIWKIDEKGIKNFSEQEISALEDAARGLREAEIKMFLD